LVGVSSDAAFCCQHCIHLSAGFPRLLESPGIVFVKFPGPGKSGDISFVLESPGICKAVMQTADSDADAHAE